MAKRPSAPTPQPVEHNAQTLPTVIARLVSVIEQIRAFDPETVGPANSAPLDALNATIARAVERAFGENTSDQQRFSRAANISGYKSFIIGGRQMQASEYQRNVAESLSSSALLLDVAVKALQDDLSDMGGSAVAQDRLEPLRTHSNRVFLVHGRDDAAKHEVARFLEQMGVQAIILHEQANQGRTVIEKIEAYSDVDFAVVLLTPDDTGGAVGGAQTPRARQNVLLELGYFLAKLGRARVCTLKKLDVEIPTDFAGVVWEPLDASEGWKFKLARELKTSGFSIDMNKI